MIRTGRETHCPTTMSPAVMGGAMCVPPRSCPPRSGGFVNLARSQIAHLSRSSVSSRLICPCLLPSHLGGSLAIHGAGSAPGLPQALAHLELGFGIVHVWRLAAVLRGADG